LIVFIDMNENYKTGAISTMLWSEGLDLAEAMHKRHTTVPVPLTFVRGNRVGSHVVDGCYMSLDLIIKKVVWPAVHKGPGDHQMPIIEVEYNDCMGEIYTRLLGLLPEDWHVASNRLSTNTRSCWKSSSRVISFFLNYTESTQGL